MSDVISVFGQPLAPDPSIALLTPTGLPAPKPGPLHRVQYVIELVGPRSVPAASVSALWRQEWQASLGEPQILVMAPADQAWRVMSANVATGSYDSTALCWDMLSPKGQLTSATAEGLLQRAESFASQIQRKALPLPPAFEIDGIVRRLLALRENLDIGISLAVHPRSGFWPERELWKTAAALGLNLSPEGSFDWLPPGAMSPLLSVTPLTDSAAFSLANVISGEPPPGVGIGFSVPRSPSPLDSLEGCFRVAEQFARSFDGLILDDSDHPLDERGKRAMSQGVMQAVEALSQSGIPPGSPEALKLFPAS